MCKCPYLALTTLIQRVVSRTTSPMHVLLQHQQRLLQRSCHNTLVSSSGKSRTRRLQASLGTFWFASWSLCTSVPSENIVQRTLNDFGTRTTCSSCFTPCWLHTVWKQHTGVFQYFNIIAGTGAVLQPPEYYKWFVFFGTIYLVERIIRIVRAKQKVTLESVSDLVLASH